MTIDTTRPAPVPEARGVSDAAVPEASSVVGTCVAGVALVLLMALVLVAVGLRLVNRDTWFHLALGDHFLNGWSLTDPGRLSPFATSPWVPTQWSTEMLASFAERLGGLPAVAWLFGSLYLALILVVHTGCRRWAGPGAATAATIAAVLGASSAISSRPQVVSFILLSLTAGAWLRTAADARARWWLVPLTWVWATAHGLWSMGVLLGLVCCVGILLDRSVPRTQVARLLCVPIMSLVAAALTPVGPRLLTSQLAVSARSSLIAEWAPTRFDSPQSLLVVAMAAVLVVLWARRGGLTWTSLLLLLLAVGWALAASRLLACGAVLLAPLLAEALSGGSDRRMRGPSWTIAERSVVAVGAVGYLVALTLLVPHTAAAAGNLPSALAARLESLPRGSVVLASDDLGGWLEWRVPAVHPVIDDMLDAYPVGWIRRYKAFEAVDPGWQRFVQDTKAAAAVLPGSSPAAAAMQDQLNWRVVDRDAGYVYLVAPRS
jgi:hypothetical protein